jgi:hypothetical protein
VLAHVFASTLRTQLVLCIPFTHLIHYHGRKRREAVPASLPPGRPSFRRRPASFESPAKLGRFISPQGTILFISFASYPFTNSIRAQDGVQQPTLLISRASLPKPPIPPLVFPSPPATQTQDATFLRDLASPILVHHLLSSLLTEVLTPRTVHTPVRV